MKNFQDFELTQDEQRNAIGKGKPEHPGKSKDKTGRPWERAGFETKEDWKAARPKEEDEDGVEEDEAEKA